MHLLIKIVEDDTNTNVLQNYYSSYKKKFETDSGIDLITPQTYTINPHQTVQINLGICCQPVSESPQGYYLYPRSSIAKTTLRLANSVGIIDCTYTGPILATVDNIGETVQIVEKGTKLFQICTPDLKPFTFELVDQLTQTARGCGAYGSTN
jgi:dUTP pyrophosphatase